mgnify:CR=1 FL=1
MGIFDCLIDKTNKKPKIGLEYIYRLDIAWNENGEVPIKIGTIVTDVIQSDNYGYEFTNKENNQRLSSNYGWSLAENTKENVKKIKKYEREYVRFEKHKKEIGLLRKNIDTLG